MFVTLVSFLLLTFSSALHEECETLWMPGTCERFTDCPFAQNVVRTRGKPDICEFEGFHPIVCCPLEEKQDEKSASLSARMCEKYHPKADFGIAVVGGEKSLPEEFPHMAVIGYGAENNKQWLCGGSLISKKFVLTAAHCLESRDYGFARWVRLGDLDLAVDTDDAAPQDFSIKRRIPHPEYKYPAKYNDIALLEIDRFVNISAYVSPACLQQSDELNDLELTATGWGQTDFNGGVSTHLLKVNLQLADHNVCSKAFRVSSTIPRGIQNETQICAGGQVGKDTCFGDSGGPLQTRNHNKFLNDERVHNIVGVTSFGKACGLSASPGVYTKVWHYLGWIESVVWPNGDD